jgi:molecular chaperone DnaK
MANDNKSLGRFKLQGIPPAPRGIPQIEVTFDIDANGIVSVSAKDLGTGKSQQVTITGGTALARDDIDRMINDAESHAADDAERKETAEARNQADHTAYQIDKQLAEHGDKLTDDEKSAIEDRVADLRKLLADDGAKPEDLRTASNELLTASQVLGQKIYEASQQQTEATAPDAEAPAGDDDVVEAEIVEDDEEA